MSMSPGQPQLDPTVSDLNQSGNDQSISCAEPSDPRPTCEVEEKNESDDLPLSGDCETMQTNGSAPALPSADVTALDPIERMLAGLIIHEEAHFRHQTRDEQPLSDAQKLTIARDLYTRRPGVFLERFGRYLDWPQDRANFVDWHDSDDLVGYFMDKLDRETKADADGMHQAKLIACRVRNRRLNALYRAARDGPANASVADHFTHEAMRERDPVLWEAMIGQHLDEPSRRRYLDRDYNTFSGFLHSQLMQQEEKKILKRARKIQQKRGQSEPTRAPGVNDLADSDLDDDDREREFLDVMKLRFVSGQDPAFDYREIDNDETLDDEDNQRAIDEEEKYFDAD